MASAGVRYLHTSCFCIRNWTSERSERVRFLIQKQRVGKYRAKHFSCGIVLRQKAQHKLTSCSVFPLPLLFRRLSTVFFIDSETNETIPFHFWNVFHFFNEKKTLWEKLFTSNVCEAGLSKLQEKAGILARNSHTSVASDWTYHFSHTWKNIVRDSDWTYHFFHVWKP